MFCMKYAVLFLALVPLSLSGQQESRIVPESTPDQRVQELIHTYCGEKPIPMSFLVQYSNGSQFVISRKELNEHKKIDPNLVVLGEAEENGQFGVCKNMVLKKAVDADFSRLTEENQHMRSALRSICALPDIGRAAKNACTALWRDLDARGK
jgi:hypothetical protein